MGPHLRARRYAPGDYIYTFYFFLCNFFYFLCFINFTVDCSTEIIIHLFISYTSEPAKGTFILAAVGRSGAPFWGGPGGGFPGGRSEEHTSELQSQSNLVC